MTPNQQQNQKYVMEDPLISEIHDRLLDDNNLDLAHAFNAAVFEIASLYRELDQLSKGLSSGFVRRKPDDNN
jgi:hypothetical protein